MSLRPDRSPNEETTEEQALIKPDDDTKPGIKFKIREIETDIAKQQALLTQIRKKLSHSESNIAMEMERLERMSEGVRQATEDFVAMRLRCSAFRERLGLRARTNPELDNKGDNRGS
ncbi:uncharacterized protein CIMG_13179 [Coccidioides immitis RS]|uniref:Uncharacterized protein n=2 Tax=Coccidioides immitis TaxID=5501 RepID=A0A0D8JUY4_COCIM|nr:uncharacterized protein CIMG_13179 [Coccidioides immitis RS]KJF60736.1 hypothetical protein CIMG_13179 [Coccidioides immitis RS]KMU75195.1 hypothetical protein CISG_04143 [Coccidioides immitis RMSCC 3703]TPX22223.1 hypothetical protein DIZ76_014089 [Coccidioides immitis]